MELFLKADNVWPIVQVILMLILWLINALAHAVQATVTQPLTLVSHSALQVTTPMEFSAKLDVLVQNTLIISHGHALQDVLMDTGGIAIYVYRDVLQVSSGMFQTVFVMI